jgi:hypothetical protein
LLFIIRKMYDKKIYIQINGLYKKIYVLYP